MKVAMKPEYTWEKAEIYARQKRKKGQQYTPRSRKKSNMHPCVKGANTHPPEVDWVYKHPEKNGPKTTRVQVCEFSCQHPGPSVLPKQRHIYTPSAWVLRCLSEFPRFGPIADYKGCERIILLSRVTGGRLALAHQDDYANILMTTTLLPKYLGVANYREGAACAKTSTQLFE